MGRSGTTNTLRVLNAHPSVALNGEIPLSILKHFFTFLDGVDKTYGERGKLSEGWQSRKSEYMLDSFGAMSKGGTGNARKHNSADFRGHKSPRLETMFEKYEQHFGKRGPLPRYFYCARNPFDCWRSYREMPWTSYMRAEEFLEDYVASFARLKVMQEHVEGRVTVVNLDELKKAPDVFEFYEEKLFAPLGIEMPGSTMNRIEKAQEDKTPSTASKLPDEDKTTIANYPGIAEILATHFPAAISASR